MVFQANILTSLMNGRNEFLTACFTAITMMAEKTFLVVILAILYWCVNKERSKRLAWFILFGAVGNGIIKNIVRMPRPYELGVGSPLRVETATSYSFPSGHTQSATSFWGGSMMILKTKASVLLGSMMIILTAFSRLYLGVHWPMDVLGAIGFGLICLYFANQFLDEDAQINKWHVLATSILFLMALIFPADADYYNAVAAIWGFCLGAYIEQKYLKFKLTQRLKDHVLRCVIGIGGLAIILGLTEACLSDIQFISMLEKAIFMLWIILGAPYIFQKIEHKSNKK